ncbi:hypothetical protein M8C21_025572 [Ambrosia artemisiifolia]|uniref:Large ribosomal subunit protein uL10-like insertion domain-containing protein n=1 Tax=Ambrosia artemisiifolia TaxID=4212 RepID=A0AAD5CI54_AMBAR|nr:hypothetical protein M8C21_025572 [Ambrosia artemisiifolia]
MGKVSKADKKIAYDHKLCQLLDDYTQVLVAAADNVGSNQLQNIRQGLRGDSVILMGKNTMMKRSIRMHSEKTGNKAYLNLIPLLVGNVGLIFTKGDLKEVREEVAKYKVGAPARVGLVAPVDVVVPPGNTGLDPSQTSFFQVLNIPTKINKGTVEIITPVELIKKGDKVGSSEAALLAKLGIRPFSYGLVVLSVYENGSVFSPEVLDLTEDDLVEKFALGVSMVTSLALAIHYPTIAAAPHMLINGYKNLLAIAVETEYSFPLADKVKEYLADPSKFAVAAPVAADAVAPAAAAAAPAETKKEEPEEEEDDDFGMKCFYAENIWDNVSEWCSLQGATDFCVHVHGNGLGHVQQKALQAVLTSCWVIWKQKNEKVFKWRKAVLEHIKTVSYIWVGNRAKSRTIEWEN